MDYQCVFLAALQRRLRSVATALESISDGDFLEIESVLLELVDPLVEVDFQLVKRGLALE